MPTNEIVTLQSHILQQQTRYPEASGQFSWILSALAISAKMIASHVRRARLDDVLGTVGNQNVQGEQQQKLDVIANIRFIRALRNGGEVCSIISEEEDEVIQTGNTRGKYIVAIDPLDGSSNIDVNVSIGTIFSIYQVPDDHVGACLFLLSDEARWMTGQIVVEP